MFELTPVDYEVINLWRSDTIRAYISGQQQQDYVQVKCSKLKAKLRELFGFFDFDVNHKFSGLEEQILIPAAELAIEMSCTPEKYQWLWCLNRFPGCIVRKRHLDCFNIMDVATHNKISKNKYNHVRETEEIGKLLLVMFPALYRRGRKGKHDILIEKATILIRVNSDLPSVTVKVDDTQRTA